VPWASMHRHSSRPGLACLSCTAQANHSRGQDDPLPSSTHPPGPLILDERGGAGTLLPSPLLPCAGGDVRDTKEPPPSIRC